MSLDKPESRPGLSLAASDAVQILLALGLIAYMGVGRWFDTRFANTPLEWLYPAAMLVCLLVLADGTRFSWVRGRNSVPQALGRFWQSDPFLPFVALLFLVTIGELGIYSSRDYGVDKGFGILLYLILPYLLIRLAPEKMLSRVWLVRAVMLLGLGLSLVTLKKSGLSLSGLRQGRGGAAGVVAGGGPIVIARWIGLAVIATLWHARTSPRFKWIFYPMAALMAVAMLPLQSRAPIAIALLCGVAVFRTTRREEKKMGAVRKRIIIAAAIALLLLMGILAYVLRDVIAGLYDKLLLLSRFEDLSDPDQSSSFLARLSFWKYSITVIRDHPFFGLGIGGWPIGFFGRDIRYYPHNCLFEVASELGLPMALAYLSFFVRATWRRIKDYRKSPWNDVITAVLPMLLFAALNSLVSGDMLDNRMVYFLLACLLPAFSWAGPRQGGPS